MGDIIRISYNPVTFDTFATAFTSCKSREGVLTDCFVYVCEGKSLHWLKTTVDHLQRVEKYTESEWIYSTPEEDKGDAIPVPVIIQQRKAQVEELH